MRKKINTINKNKFKKGFTLLETLVAVFILTLSITGPVYIASVAFRNTIDSRDNISAQYLAEEIIEVVKNKRDTIALQGGVVDWSNFFDSANDCLNDPGTSINKCIMKKNINISPKVYLFEKCLDICPNISFNPNSTDIIYGAEGVNDTSKFIREFYLEKNTTDNSDGVKLVVNIIWNDKGRDKIYTLTERLHNLNYSQFFGN